jgi:uncharacterized protein YqhQ
MLSPELAAKQQRTQPNLRFSLRIFMKNENKNILQGVLLVVLLFVVGKFIFPYIPFYTGYFLAWLADVNIYLGLAAAVVCILLVGLLGGYGRVREYFKFGTSKKDEGNHSRTDPE